MSAALYFPLPVLIGLARGVTEVAAPDYARQPAVMAYAADGETVCNTTAIEWPHAATGWGVIDTVQIWEAAPGGARLGALPVTDPLSIDMYDIARVPLAGLSLVYARIPRSFGTGRFGTYTWGFYRAFTGGSAATQARPWSVGAFGTFGYGTIGGVPLEKNFAPQHVCAPGAWAPGPFSKAA